MWQKMETSQLTSNNFRHSLKIFQKGQIVKATYAPQEQSF